MSRPRAAFILQKSFWEMVYGPDVTAGIRELTDLREEFVDPEKAARKPRLLADCEILFSTWGTPPLNEAFLEAVPKLRAFFYGAGSVRSFVTDAFWARDIVLCSSWAMNAVPVAEYTVSQIVYGLKRGRHFEEYVKKHRAYPPQLERGSPGCYGTTVGLVSLGMIAKRVARMLQSYDMRVIAYDPFVSPEVATELGVELVGLETLFASADFISLHTPWLPETEGMIDGVLLRRMKEGAVFLNTARGAVVNQEEMVQVLQERPDLEAILDVTHPEPPPPESPLFDLPNVRLTPHIAGSQALECRRMGRAMLDECRRFLNGEELRYALDKRSAAILA